MSELQRAHGRSPWDYIQDWDVELVGPEILEEDRRQSVQRAMRMVGGLPYIWQELARPVSEIVYGLLELKQGDRVLLLGEAIEPSLWDQDMQAIVGPEGRVDCVELIHDGRAAVEGRTAGRSGMRGTWRWDYCDDIADETYDCVAVMQATQHADDWTEVAGELLRVMKSRRRVVAAEAVLNGPTFFERINSDVHIRQWYEKAFGDLPRDAIPYWSPEQVLDAFGSRVENPRIFEWRGIEMFWGRKP
jgi:hypothetical protein